MATSFQYLLGLLLSFFLCYYPSTPTSHVHVIYLGHNHGQEPLLTTKFHVQLLSNVFSNEDEAKEAMLYSYKHSFSGIAAMLNSTQASTLASMEGVISVFRSKMLQLHTTRSWDFMGLTLDSVETTSMQLKYGDNIVVGVLDTGIWPESLSFQEEPGTGPIPPSWNGACVKGEKFDPAKACNRKLIGARYYIAGFEREFGPLNTSGDAEYRSPRDRVGHGTHTASTAVGSIVTNVGFFGLARGTARGGAPRARLAMYKVCWWKHFTGQCSEADILAAFDDALHDGVHVISVSLGASPPLMPFFSASSDIGSFHAAQKGVLAVFSAGNDGPEASLVENVAPWGLCVAAATIDRNFPTKILLGNNISFMGEGFITYKMKMRLVHSGKIFDDGSCSLDYWSGRKLASGRIVLCFSNIGQISSFDAALAVFAANGSGMIFVESLAKVAAEDDYLPTVHIDLYQGTQILHYIYSTKDPMVQVFPSETAIKHIVAPSIAYYSSRGPSSISPNILKPDIGAPGVNILAAWPPKSSPSMLPFDDRSLHWNLLSGTSMSCPHVSGIVALIKSVHYDWSPAAIKSALMTTAYMGDTSLDTILAGGSLKSVDPFDIGAGHVDPLRAMDPGLVYDMDVEDYIIFLCSVGYTRDEIRNMVLLPSQCIDIDCEGHHSDMDLNYAAITISNLSSRLRIKRTLRNVGQIDAIYFASINSPQGVHTIVWPRYLVFTRHIKRISYYVTLMPVKKSQGRYDFGEIIWFDGYHHVRTPLIVCLNNARDADAIPTHPSL